jgi:hypothetical protein
MSRPTRTRSVLDRSPIIFRWLGELTHQRLDRKDLIALSQRRSLEQIDELDIVLSRQIFLTNALRAPRASLHRAARECRAS